MPHHSGEQVEMETMLHEQSGLPDTSYEETPLLRRAGSISDLQKESSLRQNSKKTVDTIKGKLDRQTLKKSQFEEEEEKTKVKLLLLGRKEEYKILKDDESGLRKSFLDAFKSYLCLPTEQKPRYHYRTAREIGRS